MSKPSDEAVRKEFEAWGRTKRGFSLVRDEGGNYTQMDERQAWQAWQASRSAAIQECADKLTDGSCCRYIDHAQDYCSCADIRSALETLKNK